MAATELLRSQVNDPTAKFGKVHIIHTSQSIAVLDEWLYGEEWLKSLGLCKSDFVHHVVEMSADLDRRLDEVIGGVASAINSHRVEECYFDLTGGITLSKVALAILAFLIGAPNVYTLEVDLSDDRDKAKWNLHDLRAAGVPVAYQQIAGLERFDIFGLSNLTTVDRVASRLDELRSALGRSIPQRDSEVEHLISLLGLAEKARLEQTRRSISGSSDEHLERAATRSVLFHSMAAAEAVVDLVVDDMGDQGLGNKLARLRSIADARSLHPINLLTLRHLSDLLLHLRNRAAHWSSPTPDHESLAVQGGLGLSLAKSFIWLVTMSLESFLDETGEIARIRDHDESVLDGGVWFVGIDGDGTGGYIAAVLRDSDSGNCEQEIRDRSRRINGAITEIAKKVKETCSKDSVLFATGDNVLFRGRVSPRFVRALLDIYRKHTGLTASAGIGRTPQQASFALSLAKAEAGGAMKIVTIADQADAAVPQVD
ncbi:mCpol domain-containing protein [Actinomadura livida]|uniref:Minimal CRISPR polymerase domain-containing protein n=1 Tax=Actinomadura livida TaxID=79909 RepID=A0A7W7I7B7_9ACTN|nr:MULTISPECIES: mCpol domain-containing protein [Actinomadura]MBB4771850.1 hypothetical protein [Actinomadura catellatispora]GGU02853.1 hypothetical protein GCM10010208_28730 [Actinomadura livida]